MELHQEGPYKAMCKLQEACLGPGREGNHRTENNAPKAPINRSYLIDIII
jgi:hypothetical protein